MGKSFLMAQLAYHVSMGLPLWGYPVHKGTVLYLALEDDHRRLQGRLYRMFGMDGTNDLLFAIHAKQLGVGLEGQLKMFVREHPDMQARASVVIEDGEDVRKLEQRMAELAAADEAAAQNSGGQYSAADEH